MNGAGVGGYFLGGSSGGIKTVQSGTIDMAGVASATATISSVVLANSVLHYLGQAGASTNSSAVVFTRHTLTNVTTVTCTRKTSIAGTWLVGYSVVEHAGNVLNSSQRGSIDLNGVTSATATITSVNTAKALAMWTGGELNDAGSVNAVLYSGRVALTNATTVTAFTGTTDAVSYPIGYQVPEYL